MAARASVDASVVILVARDVHDAMCAMGATVSVDTPAGTFMGCTAESGGQDPSGHWRVRLDLNPIGDQARTAPLLALRSHAFGVFGESRQP